MRFAVIHNPRSRLNIRDRSGFAAEAQARLGHDFIATADRQALQERVAAFAARGIDTIAVNGGDGTVSHTMSAVLRAYPADRLPRIAILPSGNSNLIAADVGFGLRGIPALDALSGPATRLVHERRAPVVVRWPDTDRPAVAGMFCGSAAFSRAIEIAHTPGVLRYAPHDLALAVTLAGALGALLFSRRVRRTWRDGEALALSVDRAPPEWDRSFLFLATGLHKFVYGIWPFWRPRGQGADGLAFLNVQDNPARFPSAMASLMRGRAPRWLRGAADYRSGCAQMMRIETASSFVLDGDIFDTGPHGVVTMEAGPRLSFLRHVS